MKGIYISLIILMICCKNEKGSLSEQSVICYNDTIDCTLQTEINHFSKYIDSISLISNYTRTTKLKYSICFFTKDSLNKILIQESIFFRQDSTFLGYTIYKGRPIGFNNFNTSFYKKYVNDSLLIKRYPKEEIKAVKAETIDKWLIIKGSNLSIEYLGHSRGSLYPRYYFQP